MGTIGVPKNGTGEIIDTAAAPRGRFHPREVARRLAGRALWHIQRKRFREFGEGSLIEHHVELYQPNEMAIGREVMIRRFARLEAVGAHREPVLRIGDRCMISAFVHIGAARSVVLGEGVGVASYVLITDHEHDFSDPSDGYKSSRVLAAPIEIGPYAFIGERACILKGVKIGERAIIGVGSIVKSDVPPLTIAVGAPARVVKRWDDASQSWVSVSR